MTRPVAGHAGFFRPLTVALLCGALAWTWQFLTVTRNYGGNWTALYMAGSAMPIPPALLPGTYRFPGTGFDGQTYRIIAHDPMFRKGYSAYCDDARLRYRRILVPALAFLIAAGQDRFIDQTYIAVILLFISAGVYWTSRWATLHGRDALWGALFLLAPGTLTSIDRLLVDGPCTALFAALALCLALGRKRAVWVVLAAAALTRETAILLPAGVCLFYVVRKQAATAVFYASSALPLLIWSLVVVRHTPPSHAVSLFARPVYGLFMRLWTPTPYPFSPPMNHFIQFVGFVSACGHLLAFALALWWFFRTKQRGAIEYVALLFVAMGLMLGRQDHLQESYGYARPISPLYLFLFLRFLSDRVRVMIAPMLMVSAQILLFFAYQAMGILGLKPPRGTAS